MGYKIPFQNTEPAFSGMRGREGAAHLPLATLGTSPSFVCVSATLVANISLNTMDKECQWLATKAQKALQGMRKGLTAPSHFSCTSTPALLQLPERVTISRPRAARNTSLADTSWGKKPGQAGQPRLMTTSCPFVCLIAEKGGMTISKQPSNKQRILKKERNRVLDQMCPAQNPLSLGDF